MSQQPNRVPVPTLERMATYLACLLDLDARNVETVSSADMERHTDINAAQFRKDLSYFGEFGRPGIGYSVPELARRISKILKVDREQPVVLVGAGNLGSALVGYPSLTREHFRIAAVFDNSPPRSGANCGTWRSATWALTDYYLRKRRPGSASSPCPALRSRGELMITSGITAILNFAPVSLKVRKGWWCAMWTPRGDGCPFLSLVVCRGLRGATGPPRCGSRCSCCGQWW